MNNLTAIDLFEYLISEEAETNKLMTEYTAWQEYKWRALSFIFRHCYGNLMNESSPADEIAMSYYNVFTNGFDEYVHDHQKVTISDNEIIDGLQELFHDILSGTYKNFAKECGWETLAEFDIEIGYIDKAAFLIKELNRISQYTDKTIRYKDYKFLFLYYEELQSVYFDAEVGKYKEQQGKTSYQYSIILDAIDLFEQEAAPFIELYEKVENKNDHTNEDEETTLQIPPELNTEKAQRMFKEAINKGWINVKEGNYEWIGIDGKRSKAQLGYLCAKIYGYKYNAKIGNEGENIPYEALQRLFSVTRLDRAIQQVYEAQKPQQWRQQIDEIIK